MRARAGLGVVLVSSVFVRSIHIAFTVLAINLCLAGLARNAQAGEPALLSFAAGAFDVGKDETAFEGRVEYRPDIDFWYFRPFAGAMATSDGGAYGYAGILLDLRLGEHFVTTLSFAPGAYHKGSGKNLGHELEFRSQIELAYRFADRSRLGVAFSHMSNASLGRKNPGTENLLLTYAVPLR